MEDEGRKTVTAQVTSVDRTFLEAVVEKKDVMSKSEAVRQGLKLLRMEKGYSEKTGLREGV